MQIESPTAKVLIILASLVVVLAGLKAASAIMVPFLLSIFIAIACSPVINWASKYNVPRWMSVILVILLIVIFGLMLAGLVGNSMSEFRANMPVYEQKLAEHFAGFTEQLAKLNITIDTELLLSYLDPGIAMNMITNFLSGMGGVFTNLFLILLTVVFMLFEAESIPRRIHIAMADPDMNMQHIDKFLKSVKNYLGIKTLVSLGTGLFIGIWLYIMGVDHFLLWAVLAFLFNFIPNIGSIIAAVPAVLMAFLQFGFPSAGIAALGYVLVNTIFGNAIEPKFMGKGLGLSTLVVFLSLIFWGWLLGSVGMLLSVPLTMIVKIALESREESKWLAVMLSSAGDDDEDKAIAES